MPPVLEGEFGVEHALLRTETSVIRMFLKISTLNSISNRHERITNYLLILVRKTSYFEGM